MWSYQIGNKERASTILIAQLWKPVTNVDCFYLEADQWYLQPKNDHPHPHLGHYEGNSHLQILPRPTATPRVDTKKSIGFVHSSLTRRQSQNIFSMKSHLGAPWRGRAWRHQQLLLLLLFLHLVLLLLRFEALDNNSHTWSEKIKQYGILLFKF